MAGRTAREKLEYKLEYLCKLLDKPNTTSIKTETGYEPNIGALVLQRDFNNRWRVIEILEHYEQSDYSGTLSHSKNEMMAWLEGAIRIAEMVVRK